MTDIKNIGGQLAADDTTETWKRVSKLSHNKRKAHNHMKRRKRSQSPSLDPSAYYRKDSETPKRLSRIRLNGCNSGDSPSEADALQEIIWDPVSPPPLLKGAGDGIRGVEISDIVNRIAPNDDKPVDKDLVLQWIGDSAIPCTPEVQQPRLRKSSARRQSNNVEDLMKLAKQFDINMTRQDKERDMRRASEPTDSERLAKLIKPGSQGKGPSAGARPPAPVKPTWLSHEEELHALFDGPTQRLSGRLSPPSANCSQENRPEPASLNAKRPASAASTSMPKHPAEVPKPDFDDDWENDDLLDDSFVLEVTQNPELLASAPQRRVGGTGPAASRECEPLTITGPMGPCSRAGCPPRLPSGGSTTFSKVQCPNRSSPRPVPKASGQPSAVGQCSKPGLDLAETAESNPPRLQAPCSMEKAVMTVNTGEMMKETQSSGSPGHKDSERLAGPLEEDREQDSHTRWGDGDDDDDDDDDDLLYQACDDVERISASQEQQKQGSCSDLVSVKAPISTCKAPLSNDTSNLQRVGANSRSSHPNQATEHEQPARIFGRSHSIPGAMSALKNKQYLVASTRGNSGHRCDEPGRYRNIPVKRASDIAPGTQQTAGNCCESRSYDSSAENSIAHNSTFKRHQSDPVAVCNKAFVTVQPAVRCSAAEIERKKQEAIARRRSRLRATEKPGTAV